MCNWREPTLNQQPPRERNGSGFFNLFQSEKAAKEVARLGLASPWSPDLYVVNPCHKHGFIAVYFARSYVRRL
jgi:hypothetical protein